MASLKTPPEYGVVDGCNSKGETEQELIIFSSGISTYPLQFYSPLVDILTVFIWNAALLQHQFPGMISL